MLKYISLDISNTFYEFDNYSSRTGVVLDFQLKRAIVDYIVSNLDYNLGLCSAYWTVAGLRSYLKLGELSNEVYNSIEFDSVLKSVGFNLYNLIYTSNLFKIDLRETFPYIVRNVTTSQLILEEDTYLINSMGNE